MKVYFVRHGQSVFNKENRHQFPDTPLSDKGVQEAKAVGNRCKHLFIDSILTSPWTRALQTAEEIRKVKNVPLIQSDLFIERRMPTVFGGKLHGNPEIVGIHKTIREYFVDGRHFAEEENFSDLLKRAKKAFDFIHQQKKENLVVVTHGYFMTVMMFSMLFPQSQDSHTFISFRDHTTYSNTGLTMCEYKNRQWKLLTWNDYAHLGE